VFDSPRRNRDEPQSLTFPEPGSHCGNRQLVTFGTLAERAGVRIS
jgi:hypothetical protein